MSREKQIEEMAKDVTRSICWCNEEIPTVDGMGTAITLYNKGYRKASEVAEKIFAEIEKKISLDLDVICKEKDELIYKGFFSHALLCEFNYKIDTLRGIAKFIAELKKKYTEGENNNE
jgi:hypothetical protein